MRMLFATLTLFSAVVLVGCQRESPPGGPGAPPRGQEVQEAGTFEVEVPQEVDVNRGARQEFTVSLDRGDRFTQDVKIHFKGVPAGLKILPESGIIHTGKDEARFMVEATKDAALGQHKLSVVGEPKTGASTSVQLVVEVEEAE